MSSNSEQYYSALQTLAGIKKLIEERTQEGLHLEFKKKVDTRTSALENTDKEGFSEVLSQFANSDGGVLVYGVGTAKPGDYASELFPIQNPNDFAQRLSDFIPAAIEPMVDGIQYTVIQEKDNSGYVVFHIPVSQKTPHRAMITREYLKRTQTGKTKLEHFDLEDMFGRRQKPNLRVELELLEHTLNDNKPIFRYKIQILNEGRATAEGVIAIIEFPNNDECSGKIDVLDVATLKDFSAPAGKRRYQVYIHDLVYPELPLWIGNLHMYFQTAYRPPENFPSIKITIAAKNMLKKDQITDLPDLYKDCR